MLKLDIKKLQVYLALEAFEELMSYRQTKPYQKESAGALIGNIFPENNSILITEIIPSKKAMRSRTSVRINDDELNTKIRQKWQDSKGALNYLGDWHTHPENTPKPSFLDRLSFMENSLKSRAGHNAITYIIVGQKYGIENMWAGCCNSAVFISKKPLIFQKSKGVD